MEGIQQRTISDGEDNPYFIAYGINNGFLRNRVYGSNSLNWDIMLGLSAMGRFSLNTNDESRETKIPWSYSRMAQGGYLYSERGVHDSNTEFVVTYQTRLPDCD